MKEIGQANRNEGSWKKEHRQGRHPRNYFVQHVRGRWKNQLRHVILEELSCWVETVILDESRAISRSIRLSAWKDWSVFPFALCKSWPIVIFGCFWMRGILKILWLTNRWYCWKAAWGIDEVLKDTEYWKKSNPGRRWGPPEWYESSETSEGALPLLLRYDEARNSGWIFFFLVYSVREDLNDVIVSQPHIHRKWDGLCGARQLGLHAFKAYSERKSRLS